MSHGSRKNPALRMLHVVSLAVAAIALGLPATAGNGFLIDDLKQFSGLVPPPAPPDCTGSPDCYVDDVNGNDANGGASFADAKKTIQAGIDAVGAGGTVHVAPGTYDESPVVDKSLQLVSSGGRDVTTIQLQAGPEYLGGLTIKGNLSQVTVDGFTIAGSDGDALLSRLANSNVVVYSGQVSNTPLSVFIKDSRLKVANVDPGFTTGDDGIGLVTYANHTGTNEVDSISVRGTIFEPLHGVGSTAGTRAFFINPGLKQFNFELNEITGQFNRGSYTQANGALLNENTVTGVGSPGSRSGGLGTWGYPDPTVYGHAVFSNNVVNGTSGIHIYESEQVTVTNNVLVNNDWAVSVGFLTALPFDASTIDIGLNSIIGTSNGIESDALVIGTVNAERNWWGSASGPTNPGNPGGTGDKATGDVDFDPWLCDGTDTNLAAIGFQPNPDTSPCTSLGSLTVTKTVNWRGAPPNAAQTFSICITGPSYPSGNCQTAAYSGGPLTWNGLDAGSYSVTEDPGSAWTVAISGSPATVTGGQTAQASVTNTLKPGRLVVFKRVRRPFRPFNIRQRFEICIAGPSYPTPNCRTFGPLGGLRIWGPIVPGSYTVTETNPGPGWFVTISGSPAVVPPNRTAAALVTNSRTGAAIGVTKEEPPIALDGSAVGFTHQLAPRR